MQSQAWQLGQALQASFEGSMPVIQQPVIQQVPVAVQQPPPAAAAGRPEDLDSGHPQGPVWGSATRGEPDFFIEFDGSKSPGGDNLSNVMKATELEDIILIPLASPLVPLRPYHQFCKISPPPATETLIHLIPV